MGGGERGAQAGEKRGAVTLDWRALSLFGILFEMEKDAVTK